MIWTDGFIKANFDRFSAKPWTLGYRSLNEPGVDCAELEVYGDIPRSLRGTFFRNGPARHERGSLRYAHKWDGDGLIQAFGIGDGRVSHRARYVATKKHVAEDAADRFLVSAFSSPFPGNSALTTDVDDMNAANISVCAHNGDLLALWEAGSAYSLDPATLATRGVKAWHSDEQMRPFSAHPRIEPNGTLWNFGCDPISGVLSVYRVTASGAVDIAKRFDIPDLPPIHDFAITENHLVFVMSPLRFSPDKLRSGMSFAESTEWAPSLATRVLTLRKGDWSLRWYELPPLAVFHIGNAWEDKCGVIRLDFMGARDPRSMISGWTVMHGQYQHARGAVLTLAVLDPVSGARLVPIERAEAEFPRVDPALVGQRYRNVLCLVRGGGRADDAPGWDQVGQYDVESDSLDAYCYGNDWLVEEHVYAPTSTGGEPPQWIVGTALDLKQNQTVLFVFAANSLSAGPIAQARLPYGLPVAIHGIFVPRDR